MDYAPTVVPSDPKEIPRYLQAELSRLAQLLISAPARQVEFLNVAPTKPREGMIFGADGTHWNPGSGQGLYCYYGGVWVKL